MYLMYADESGSTGIDYDNPQQKVFTLAGLAVSDEDWYELNNYI